MLCGIRGGIGWNILSSYCNFCFPCRNFESKAGEDFLGLRCELTFESTVEKSQRLCAIIKTIPRNATYTSSDMQSELIAAVRSAVTESIKQENGNSW